MKTVLCRDRWCYPSATCWLLLHMNLRGARTSNFVSGGTLRARSILSWFRKQAESDQSIWFDLPYGEKKTMFMQVTWELNQFRHTCRNDRCHFALTFCVEFGFDSPNLEFSSSADQFRFLVPFSESALTGYGRRSEVYRFDF